MTMPETSNRNFDGFRKQLLEIKAQAEADLDTYQRQEQELSGGPDEPGSGGHWEHSGYGDHLADEGTELFEREKSIGMEQSLRDHLRQVDHALSRIEDGSYGQCERCGRPIPDERHQALPEATLCIECKALEEREAAHRATPAANER
jgi:RNA polymerase-binding transcription factor DksA